eukprot:759491-Hanusia_phi.AAC.1
MCSLHDFCRKEEEEEEEEERWRKERRKVDGKEVGRGKEVSEGEETRVSGRDNFHARREDEGGRRSRVERMLVMDDVGEGGAAGEGGVGKSSRSDLSEIKQRSEKIVDR